MMIEDPLLSRWLWRPLLLHPSPHWLCATRGGARQKHGAVSRDDRQNWISRDVLSGHGKQILCWAFVIRLKMVSSHLRLLQMPTPWSPLMNVKTWSVVPKASCNYEIFVWKGNCWEVSGVIKRWDAGGWLTTLCFKFETHSFNRFTQGFDPVWISGRNWKRYRLYSWWKICTIGTKLTLGKEPLEAKDRELKSTLWPKQQGRLGQHIHRRVIGGRWDTWETQEVNHD